MLAAQLPDVELAGDPASASRPPDPAAVSRKIDDFIAAHPDQQVANSALRVRQAILLITCGKYELARSAFAGATELKTDRDQALKNLSEPLIWWWEHSQATALNETQRAEARRHLEAFDKEIAAVQASPDIRDFLAETRARIGLKLVASLQIADGKRDAFVDVLNHYSATFTAEDVAAIKAGNLAPQATAITPAEKRRIRGNLVKEKAKEPAQVLRDRNQPVTAADLEPAARGFGELVLGQ